MAITNYLAHTMLSRYFSTAGAQFVGLHVADPTNAGLADTELSTATVATYERKVVTWSNPANRAVTNNTELIWLALPVVSIGFLGIWDSLAGGNLLAVVEISPVFEITKAGGSIRIPTEGIAVVFGGSPQGRIDPAASGIFPEILS